MPAQAQRSCCYEVPAISVDPIDAIGMGCDFVRSVLSLTTRHSVAYIGPYPPDPSGAAEFTLDLVNSTDLYGWQSFVIAVEPCAKIARDTFDSKVEFVLDPSDKLAFRKAVHHIASREASVVCLQLAPGVFDRASDTDIAAFLNAVQRPLVVVIHGLSATAQIKQRRIIELLVPGGAVFVSLTHAGVKLLADVYQIPRAQIRYIPLGAPNIEASAEASEAAKSRLGLSGKIVLTTIGCLDEALGAEETLSALRTVVDRNPRVVLQIISGQEASSLLHQANLDNMIDSLALRDHVLLADHHLDFRELIDHIAATDIYVSARRSDPVRITSSALAMAFVAGKLVVSTPTTYAQELLANRRGYIVPFRDPDALARRLNSILSDGKEAETIRSRAYAFGRGMTWQEVGIKYVELFNDLLTDPRGTLSNPVQPQRGQRSVAVWERARLKGNNFTSNAS